MSENKAKRKINFKKWAKILNRVLFIFVVVCMFSGGLKATVKQLENQAHFESRVNVSIDHTYIEGSRLYIALTISNPSYETFKKIKVKVYVDKDLSSEISFTYTIKLDPHLHGGESTMYWIEKQNSKFKDLWYTNIFVEVIGETEALG